MKKFFVIIFLILFVLIFYSFFIYKKPMPSFKANDINNNLISKEVLKGKVVLINFWYPSCPGCFEEMVNLNALYEKYSKNSYFKLIGISANYNSLSQVKEYIKLRNIRFPVIYDKDDLILSGFGANIMPMTFLITKKGYIYDLYIGQPNWKKLEKNIKYLLGK